MLSIFNTYLLRNPQVQNEKEISAQENEFYGKIFEMVCEILDSYRDTYVNLHCVLTMSVFLKNLVHAKSEFYGKYMGGVKTLMIKLSSSGIGLDDASALHLGYAIVNMLSRSEINDET